MRERLSLYFLLAVLLPLTFGTLVSERLIERHIVGLARSSAEERLDSVAGRLEDRARFVQMGLSQLAASRELLDAAAAADPTLVSSSLRGALMPRQLDVLALVASDGHLVSRTGGKRDHITLDLKQDLALRRAFAGETVISYEILDGLLVQAVTVPVRERDRTLGALMGATILTGNDTLCAHLVDRGQGEAALAQGSSWTASSWLDDSRGPSFVGSALRGEQLAALQRRQRWAGPSPGPGAGYMAVGPLSDAGGQVVGGVAGLVSTAGLSALQVDARRSFFAAMGLGALAALVLALVAARRMTGPLRRLAQAATEMQKGKLDKPIEVEGDDEVAQLASALKQTAHALHESMATLESRVQERVHELTEAHDREAALNRELIAHNEQLRSQGETLRAQGEELERQRAELVEKTRRSEEADRLKSAFIANMSHEIRTPLNSVLALSQLLRDGMAGALSNDQRRYLEVIERNGQNLLRLINDILDLSRIEAGHLEMDLQPTDIGAQIRSTVGILAPLAEAKGLDLHARLPDDLPAVRCDVDRVRQILTNLIGNAIKFTETGQVQVSGEARGDLVAVHVTDTGVGIPDSAKAKVFEEFFQVDQSMARRQGGTGLGLAIASRLARLMGGEITFDSVVGSGSRFTLTLPRSVEERDHRRIDVAAEGETALAGRTVMLLDDHADDRRQVSALLQEMGVRAETPVSAEKALAELRWESSRFSALLIDPTPAGSIGAEIAAAIEGDVRLGRLPLIVLSSHDLTVRDREQLAHSAFGFARKGETLPIALGPMLRKALRAPAATHGHAPPPARDSSILIVEDNEDNLFTLRQILANLLVDLVTASTGREAIEYCRRRLPDVIIMDMQMPGMSGLQATGAIRALPGGPTIPIIALTAQAMKGDRERILAAGCDEYLPKPIQPKVLLATIKRLLTRRGEAVGGRGEQQPAEEGEHGTHTPGR
jgi:signal transduction histidine kinase/FixJ family two-component response regulator